jgi:hypothetical protein
MSLIDDSDGKSINHSVGITLKKKKNDYFLINYFKLFLYS